MQLLSLDDSGTRSHLRLWSLPKNFEERHLGTNGFSFVGAYHEFRVFDKGVAFNATAADETQVASWRWHYTRFDVFGFFIGGF